MSVVLITGSAGLIGSETAKFFHQLGYEIVGIDNNLRQYFFGEEASTLWKSEELKKLLPRYTHMNIDIRDFVALEKIFVHLGKNIELIVHTAAQPSHDWAAKEPFTDFHVNATGTLHLMECMRKHCSEATFIFTSTNKVYGDAVNELPIRELKNRFEIDEQHLYFQHGIDESMSIDQSKHSLFGVSKAAADLIVQEYGRYFGLKTGIFRGGCLTGPAHSGAELHGFLAYLVKCAMSGKAYTVFGHKGKQVRDNIHSFDLVNAFWHFQKNPKVAAVYNMGGGRHSNCSLLEAVDLVEELSGSRLRYEIKEENRSGDHIWWISDVRKFQKDYPEWQYHYDMRRILKEIIEVNRQRGRHEVISGDSRP